MPWCEPCSRYFAPTALTTEGKCPACNRGIEVGRRGGSGQPTLSDLSKMSGEKAPWHFKLLMAMLIAYLGWRLIAPFVD